MASEPTAAKGSTANPRNAVRTKSRRQIREQMLRISNQLPGDFGENPRIDRVWDIANRYEENIMRTQQYNRDLRNLMTSIGGARKANSEKLWTRQYKRSTYMGR